VVTGVEILVFWDVSGVTPCDLVLRYFSSRLPGVTLYHTVVLRIDI
jgi:hypothetical protein